MTEIEQDHSEKSIASLCSEGSAGMIDYTCFSDAQPLNRMLFQFYHLSYEYPSGLFERIWQLKLKEVARAKLNLTFNDVVTKVWIPTFEECCQLIDSVKNGSITLLAVDQYFHHPEGQMDHHLTSLFKGIEACFDRKVESSVWIRSAVDRMQQYWSLCEQADAASTVMELKDSLKLRGNFEIIETVASTFATSMEKATLNDINERVIETRSFLEQFTKDKKKLESLKSFAACLNIVEWIRKESEGTINQ